jgi:hypothetical protein
LLHAGGPAGVQYGGAAIPRGPHTQNRAALSAAAIALLLLPAAAAAQPTGLAPYRFATPYGTSPLDQEKARVYQDQLRRDLPRTPPSDATEAARDRDMRSELDRVDRVLERQPPLTPSVGAENPVPERGPVTASGGHRQPTPAEVQDKEQEKGKEQPEQQRKPSQQQQLAPVYDLFGQKLQ